MAGWGWHGIMANMFNLYFFLFLTHAFGHYVLCLRLWQPESNLSTRRLKRNFFSEMPGHKHDKGFGGDFLNKFRFIFRYLQSTSLFLQVP